MKMYFYFKLCRLMSHLWGVYHRRVLHKPRHNFFASCGHINPWRRAYNDIIDMQKRFRSQ